MTQAELDFMFREQFYAERNMKYARQKARREARQAWWGNKGEILKIIAVDVVAVAGFLFLTLPGAIPALIVWVPIGFIAGKLVDP